MVTIADSQNKMKFFVFGEHKIPGADWSAMSDSFSINSCNYLVIMVYHNYKLGNCPPEFYALHVVFNERIRKWSA